MTATWSDASPWERATRLVALAILLAYGLGMAAANLTSFGMEDADAYWNAAARLIAGEPLYVDTQVADTYRYAPWFAWAWVPLVSLPKEAVMAVWGAVLLVCSFACVWPVISTRTAEGIALGALCLGLLVRTASTGNVQPLLLAGLVYGVGTRAGPVVIALAASLKATPIVFALGYVGERRWGMALASVGLTVLLVAPMLLYDLSTYPPGLWTDSPWITFPLAIAGGVVALTSERYRWLGVCVAVMFALPRLYPYTLTYLLVSTASLSTVSSYAPGWMRARTSHSPS